MAIPRFIQLSMPLPPLKPMGQSRRGVIQMMEAQAHPLIMAIPRFIQLTLYFVPLSVSRNTTENFERPALSDHVILVGAPIVLNPPTKAAAFW
jgi:hypothetical protein